jgi:hypothetical protein
VLCVPTASTLNNAGLMEGQKSVSIILFGTYICFYRCR